MVRVSATFGPYKLPPGTDDDEPVEGNPAHTVFERNERVDRRKRYLVAGGPAAVAAGAPGETRTPTPLRETDFESLGANVSILLGRQNWPVFKAVIGIFGWLSAAHLAGTFSQPPCTFTQELHNSYAREMAWREDPRRKPNGMLYLLVASAALAHPVSREWKGYWQRSH